MPPSPPAHEASVSEALLASITGFGLVETVYELVVTVQPASSIMVNVCTPSGKFATSKVFTPEGEQAYANPVPILVIQVILPLLITQVAAVILMPETS